MKFQSLVPNKMLWIASTLFVVVLFVAAGVRYINFFPTLTSQGKNLSVAYSYFIDSSNSHVLSYVRKAAIFRNIEDPKEIPWQLGKKSYWIKLEVDNLLSEHRHMSLYFDTPMIDKLSIYQFNVEGQETQQWSLGDSSQRDYRMGDMPPAIHFSLDGFEHTTLYMQVYSTGIPVMPIWILEQHEFHLLTQLLHTLWGGFIAIMLLVAIYTAAVYVSLKERVYAVYVGYVLTALLQLGAIHGFGIYLFPSSVQLLLSNNIVALTFGLFWFSLLFAHLYLRVHKSNSLLRQVVHYGLWVLAGLMGMSLFLPEHIAGTFLIAMQPMFYGLIGTLVWVRWQKGHNWGRMFIMSWLPLVIAGVFPPLLATGVIEYTLFSRYAFMMGTVLAVLFMALALGERFRQQRRESVYQLTHDETSLLPNLNVMSFAVSNLIARNREFTLCCFQIDRFSSLSLYMSEDEKRYFVGEICSRLRIALDSDNVSVLETTFDKHHRLASLKEGKFGFIILSTDAEKVKLLVSSMLDEVDSYIELNAFGIRIQGSVGTSCFPKDGKNADLLINKSFQAVEDSNPCDKKINAYDSLKNFNRTMNMSLVADLKKAIDNDTLELYHQPQVDLRTGSIHGSEVLLRWDHPKFGQISPEVFVKLAEEVGMINDLTMWVIRRAFFQQSKLMDQGFNRRLSINVSATDIAIPNLVDRIADIADSYSVPTGLLSLELTESTMVSDYERLHEVIDKLSQRDIEVSIDDYGTGYSSLTYLSQLPFTELKIDRSFIHSLTSSPRKQNIVRATTEMAKSLGLMVVAEGVEDLETASVLKRYGVDIAQGYHYSRALSFNQYMNYMRRTSHQVPLGSNRSRKLGS
ncbi:putative bifunctional diguanylate cyclase/phosphodiesterase [Enterovibrio norvegicus]|uniref:putative bifunctional diguanylate cyclase/phosphodiesterase n=1 Tax=Enterovibrio norvegicus TaxID=188144 RepID=UPI000C8292E8|nr:EAL domain-containing protein [Enterovibrio norvegicus]PML81969.1 signal protein [Enterovibrio norvegicus]